MGSVAVLNLAFLCPSLSGALYVLDRLLELVGLNLRVVRRQSKGYGCFRQFDRTHAHYARCKFGDGVTTIVISVGGLPFAIRDS